MPLEVKSAKQAFEEARKRDQHRDHFVWWDNISQEDTERFSKCLDSATREQDVQNFLEENPILLIQHLGGGHGRWVIPQQRLGSEFVTDFVIGHRDSMGYHWQAVELESPLIKSFNANGDPSRHLNHAIRQITDWRHWLVSNQNYASRSKAESGLGLTDITHDIPALIIIGRDGSNNPDTNKRRRQLGSQSGIEIHPYDWLVRNAMGRISALEKIRT